MNVTFLSAQVQVLSAALKAAQLDSPTDDSPTEMQPEEQPESDNVSPPVESKPMEVLSESDESPSEEEQTVETPPASESSPVQEQGDEETQTEPLEDPEESPPDSPVLVRIKTDLCSLTMAGTDILSKQIPDLSWFCRGQTGLPTILWCQVNLKLRVWISAGLIHQNDVGQILQTFRQLQCGGNPLLPLPDVTSFCNVTSPLL